MCVCVFMGVCVSLSVCVGGGGVKGALSTPVGDQRVGVYVCMCVWVGG